MAAPSIAPVNECDSYSAVVVSSRRDAHQLTARARPLLVNCNPMLDPEFFLASLTDGWTPCIVAVSRGGTTVGILYAKERRIAGLSTGIVYADGSLGNMVVAEPTDQEAIFSVAIHRLVTSPHVRGVRLVIPPNGFEQQAITRMLSLVPLDAFYSRTENHARLVLPSSYEEFLQAVGSETRQNFRRYRKRFEAEGHHFIEQLSNSELRQATWDLAAKCRFSKGPGEVARSLNVTAAVGHPLAVALKHRNGEWLSVAGGWYTGGRVTLFFQHNNDRECPHQSLSTVLRVKLVEMLIRQGIQEIVFWAGTSGLLSRYVSYIPAVAVHLDVTSKGWATIRSLIAWADEWMPRQIGGNLRWIAPFRGKLARREL